MVPTRQWAQHLSQLRNRAAKLRGHTDTTDATRRLIDEALGSCEELLDDFNRCQVECGRLRDDVRAAIRAHRRMFDYLPCACVTTNQQGTILQANTAAGRLLNITSKWLEGRELMLYSQNRDAFLRLIESLPLKETPLTVPMVMRPRERRPVETMATLMPVADNQPGVLLWFLLVTPRKLVTLDEDQSEIRDVAHATPEAR